MIRGTTLVLCALLALAGCAKPSTPITAPAAADPGPVARTGSATPGPDREDPCQLLEVKEVESVLGPLAGPPYRSEANNNEPKTRGDACRYEAADLRSIALNVDWTGGSAMLQAMGVPAQVAQQAENSTGAQGVKGGSLLHNSAAGGAGEGKMRTKGQMPKEFLPYDIPFAGEWDDVRVIGCCIINAFLGDALIVLDYTASKATPAQAVSLINKALLRLANPLASIDGRAGVAPALQRLATRAKHPKACELVPRVAAEAIVGRLTAEPAGDADSCEYHYRSGADRDGSGSDEVVHVRIDWSYGFDHFRDQTFARKTAGLSMPGFASGADAANVGAQTMSDLGKAMQSGGGSFDSLARAVKETAAKSQGMKTAVPDGNVAQPKAPAPVFEGPWDEAAFAYPEFLAVKKDILIRVEAGLTPEIGQKFAAHAMAAL